MTNGQKLSDVHRISSQEWTNYQKAPLNILHDCYLFFTEKNCIIDTRLKKKLCSEERVFILSSMDFGLGKKAVWIQ